MINKDNEFWGSIDGKQQVLKADLDKSNNGVVITDYHAMDNRIIYCNEVFEKLTG
jgi:PAS domain-containing protein